MIIIVYIALCYIMQAKQHINTEIIHIKIRTYLKYVCKLANS